MRRTLLSLIIVLLASCGGQKSQNDRFSNNINDAAYYLKKAQESHQPDKSRFLLKAGIVLGSNNQFLKAQEAFSFLKPEHLSLEEKETYYLYYAHSLLNLSQNDTALKLLRKIESPKLHSVDWQIFYQTTLSQAYLNEHNYYEAAVIRINLEDLIMDAENISENHTFIWKALNQLTEASLLNFQTEFNNTIVNGWLEIAYLNKKNVNNPNELIRQLMQWRQRFASHPANLHLPEELKKVAEAKTYQPKQIALLLPLSGQLSRSGRMIRDGFMAAHYSDQDVRVRPMIKVYDTALAFSATTPYKKAIEDGADFIVGPLTKDAVTQIATQELPRVPHLNLNRTDLSDIPLTEFFQFGLPIEDEARQIAQLAMGSQYKTAVVLVPTGSQGDRIVESFSSVFESMTGKVAEVQRFDNPKEIKDIVKDLLNINSSEKRYSNLKQTLGLKDIEYVQRRRKDVDIVFLAASPKDARLIKPFLNFYYALNLPVYAISMINDGEQETRRNKDLNGIVFTDSPLLISEDENIQKLRAELAQILPQANSPMGRLFALGYDAYRIIPDLNKLQAFDQYKMLGLSGKLSVNQNGVIERQLTVAKFNQGKTNEIVETIVSQ